jgi:hypothetical protein
VIQAGLSFEQAPPLAAPLRFFLTAPLFLLAAGALMLYLGPQTFAVRWAPQTMALTHLVTLGFIAQVMFGALLQVLPVVAGAPVAHSRGIASVAHLGLNLGTLALAAGFLSVRPWLLQLAAVLLAIGAGTIILGGVLALRRSRAVASPTVSGLHLAFAGLAVTVVLGVLLALSLASGYALPLLELLSAHVAWGLLGWILALVAAVAYQVVPMFQMTPQYPARLSRHLLPALFAGLALQSLAEWPGFAASVQDAIGILLAALVLAFAAGTLWLQRRRRRRLRDATVMFWQFAMSCLAAAALLWVVGLCSATLADDPRFPFTLGALMLGGFALSVINGMLYKIVPFLVWFHLQARAPGRSAVKSMKDVIDDSAAKWHFAVHVLASALLFGAVLRPAWLFHPAAALTSISAAWLARNLVIAAGKMRGAAPRPG